VNWFWKDGKLTPEGKKAMQAWLDKHPQYKEKKR
jgi:hypothetical protein